MGNSDSTLPSFAENQGSDRSNPGQNYVIHFMSCTDVPAIDLKNDIFPETYLKAYICEQLPATNNTSMNKPEYKRISDIVRTPYKNRNKDPIWNSYKNLRIHPPPDSYLKVELYDRYVHICNIIH